LAGDHGSYGGRDDQTVIFRVPGMTSGILN
jgi:hypothetical protein